MAQKPHAPEIGAAFYLQHHFLFELLYPRVSEIEGNSDGRASVWTKPFIAAVTARLKGYSFRFELGVKVPDAGFELAAGNFYLQIANPHAQQLLVGQVGKVGDRSRGFLVPRLVLVFGGSHGTVILAKGLKSGH